MNSPLSERPHRRFNALTGDWILVSPQRTKRPWQGRQEATSPDIRPGYDPKCYLCPGNERAAGLQNPAYASTYVFDNDFAAILPMEEGAETGGEHGDDLVRSEAVNGTCRVICFSPRHDLTLPEMSVPSIRTVVETWIAQTTELGAKYRWVQVFENKGDVMGCSNPHPHGQIWASNFLPDELAKEERQQAAYFQKHGSTLLDDYLERELQDGSRVVVENTDWVGVVPYWATWPYETLLLPRRDVRRMPELSEEERGTLAEILKRLTTRYDNLFNTSFPYSMGWHGAPTGSTTDAEAAVWRLHAHFYPPLLRSATVKKFMVGYEMLAEAQRDLTPEQAAEKLRGLSEVHFKSESRKPESGGKR